jgi:hypothetical protein
VAATVLRRPRGVAVVGPYAHARDLPAPVRDAVRAGGPRSGRAGAA